MKRFNILLVISYMLLNAFSCQEEIITADFEDAEDKSIYNFVLEADSLYGDFLTLLDTTGVGMTISAYNPYSQGYTLFLPSNEAMQEFYQADNGYGSLDQLVADMDYATLVAKYHVVNLAIDANDFPFGALPEYTLSNDLLTISFVIENDSSVYKVNNQAPVTIPNNELSNGFVHVIGKVLRPINYSTYEWLQDQTGYAIFTEAVSMTGFQEVIGVNQKLDSLAKPNTLLIEPDSVFNREGIFSVQDLIDSLGVENTDYDDPGNGLYQFVGYHILDANIFLDDLTDIATNFTTYADVPLNINGRDIEIKINRGKQIFDKVIVAGDTLIIDYISFYYDESNIITQSGAIHLIDRVMKVQNASRATVTFQFHEEQFFNEVRVEPGEYMVEDSAALSVISWTGPELVFVKSADENHPAWSQDYLLIDGDFSVTYNIPKIVQGTYDMFIQAHAYSDVNAVVEVFLDGKKVGGLIDLSNSGSASNPFFTFDLGTVDLAVYETHVVELRSLIPGKLEWDWVRFEPK